MGQETTARPRLLRPESSPVRSHWALWSSRLPGAAFGLWPYPRPAALCPQGSVQPRGLVPARPSPPLLPTSPLFFLFPVIFLEILLLAAPTSRTAGLASPFPWQEEGTILGPWGQRLLRILWEGHWGERGVSGGAAPCPSLPCGCSVHGVCGFPQWLSCLYF